jgi:hypothetical protein
LLYREIIAVFSEIHTKHKNTLCGQNVELLNVKLVVQGGSNMTGTDLCVNQPHKSRSYLNHLVHIVTTGLSVCNEETQYFNSDQKPFFVFRFNNSLQPYATAGVVYRNLLRWPASNNSFLFIVHVFVGAAAQNMPKMLQLYSVLEFLGKYGRVWSVFIHTARLL